MNTSHTTEVRLPVKAMCIGASTGGPEALIQLFSEWRTLIFPVPIFVVVHMPKEFTSFQANRLAAVSGFSVHEAEDGMLATPGHVYVAPGDYHLKLKKQHAPHDLSAKTSYPQIHLSKEDPVHFCRPAVDVTLNSMHQFYGAGIAVGILTGMGKDGAQESKMIWDAGGRVAVQDEESSTVWGMPAAVLQAGVDAPALDIPTLARRLASWCKALPRPHASFHEASSSGDAP